MLAAPRPRVLHLDLPPSEENVQKFHSSPVELARQMDLAVAAVEEYEKCIFHRSALPGTREFSPSTASQVSDEPDQQSSLGSNPPLPAQSILKDESGESGDSLPSRQQHTDRNRGRSVDSAPCWRHSELGLGTDSECDASCQVSKEGMSAFAVPKRKKSKKSHSMSAIPEEEDAETKRRKPSKEWEPHEGPDRLSTGQPRVSRLVRTALIVGFGVARATGQKNRLLRKLAFFPPSPPGYRMVEIPSQTKSRVSRFILPGSRLCGVSPREPLSSVQVTETQLELIRKDTHAPRSPRDLLERRGAGKLEIYSGILTLSNRGSNIAFALVWFRSTPSQDHSGQSFQCKRQSVKPRSGDLALLPLVIFSHGNSTDLGHAFNAVVNLARGLNCNVLVYDYAGYGCSEGRLTDKTGAKDLALVHRFAVEVLQVPSNLIILYGQSIGSIPTCALACRPVQYPIGGMILHSPIASALRLILQDPSRVPFVDVFHNADRVGDCPWPIQFIHGTDDVDIPVWHCHLLYELARDPARASRQSCDVFVRDVVSRLQGQRGSAPPRSSSNPNEVSLGKAVPFPRGLTRLEERRRAETFDATFVPNKDDCSMGPALMPTKMGGAKNQLEPKKEHVYTEKEVVRLVGRWWLDRARLCIISGAGHNDIETKHRKELFATLRSFLLMAVPTPKASQDL